MTSNDRKKIAFCGLSDRLKSYDKINKLRFMLEERGYSVEISDVIFRINSTPKERAKELERFFLDKETDMIFDVTGGDLSSETLEFFDYDLIKENYKPFFGYSDLTCVLNAICQRCEKEAYLWQIKNILYRNTKEFLAYLAEDKDDLFNFKYKFFRGSSMEGTVMGGNIRCLLKTAGTPYFPNLKGKILFLESNSGGLSRTKAYFAQLRQMGVFDEISGLLLGTFTELERSSSFEKIAEIAMSSTQNIPIAKTSEIGHSPDSKILVIGKDYKFSNQ